MCGRVQIRAADHHGTPLGINIERKKDLNMAILNELYCSTDV
jgi:hypothetical protein